MPVNPCKGSGKPMPSHAAMIARQSVTTITVNQWRVKSNAETGSNEPVICVNTYAFKKVHHSSVYNHKTGDYEPYNRVEWGPKIGETEHYHNYYPKYPTTVRYDPINKTPCEASCWMEMTHRSADNA